MNIVLSDLITHTGWSFEYVMKKPLPVLYAFHSQLSEQYKPDPGQIPPEYRTGTQTRMTRDGKRQEIKTYYLGDVKDDPAMQSEIENIFGVKE